MLKENLFLIQHSKLKNKSTLLLNIFKWYHSCNSTHFFSFKENTKLSEIKKITDLDESSTQNSKYKDSTSEKNIIFVKSKTLSELKEEIDKFEGCALKKTASNMVFSDGNSRSNVMLIGEAPGEEEDKTGIPFKGQAGLLLDKMLNAIGQNRDNTYITNLIFWRPPGNRNPTEEEIDICLPFVIRHIELVKPKILILTGAIAAKAILKENIGIIQLRGKWNNLKISKSLSIKTMPIFHPAFLLRQPSRKREAWEDLKKIKSEIDLIT